MADTKISALTSASTLAGSEMIPGVQSGGNVKLTALQLKTYAVAGLVIGTAVQAHSAKLDAFAGLTFAADKGVYATGAGALATYDLTSFGRTLGGLADAAAGRTALGLVIGTDVQAQNSNLASLAGLTLAADKLVYATGAGALALADLTAFGRSLLAGVDAAAVKATLEIGDQTITLTGDVTGSGTGSFATAIGAAKVTSAMLNADVFSTAHSWGGQQTFTAPVLGAATATSINKVAITAPATSATLAIADGKTLTVSNSLTLAGTDSTTMTFPSTSATIARTDVGQTFTGRNVFAGGALGDGQQVLALTATQPASPTGAQIAIAETVTGAGTASQASYARSTTYAAGYTGTSFNAAARFVNLNAGALSSGLLVSLANTNPSASAALVADNGATTQAIFRALDNGAAVFTIADGGGATFTALLTAGSIVSNSNMILAGTGSLLFSSRSRIVSPSDGNLVLTNTAQSDFDTLAVGGATTAFPALTRSGTSLQVRLGDKSAFTNIQGKLTTDTAYTGGVVTDTGYLTIYDSTGTAYKVPCVAA